MQETSYDKVVYQSNSFDHTRPAYLAAVGKLFGLDVPDYKTARVLELGCAAGGNIIPLAEVNPKATFVGVDYAKRQIDMGKEFIENLGIQNIELKHMSVGDINEDFGEFDFIIVHGLYSWVDRELQLKILDVLNKNLSPNGLAHISYNTLPGWNMVRTIRDMMIYHTKDIEDVNKKAEQARSILNFMADGLKEGNSPYAQMMRMEMELLQKHEDYYLIHEHLEDSNQQFYFHEFMADARAAGLEYLADTELQTMFLDNLPKDIADTFRNAKEIVHIEQYMDFFSNRRFRNTILVKKDRVIKRNLSADDARPFYFSSKVEAKVELAGENLQDHVNVEFSSETVNLNTNDRLSKLALKILGTNRNRPISFQQLVERLLECDSSFTAEEVANRLLNHFNLIALIFKGALKIHLDADYFRDDVPEKPEFFNTARLQATNSNKVTNMRHQQYVVSEEERFMIMLMTGANTIDEISEGMMEHYKAGRINVEGEGAGKLTDDDVRSVFKSSIENAVRNYMGIALIK